MNRIAMGLTVLMLVAVGCSDTSIERTRSVVTAVIAQGPPPMQRRVVDFLAALAETALRPGPPTPTAGPFTPTPTPAPPRTRP